MPRYRCCPLWDDARGDMLDPANLGLSESLVNRIAKWDALFQATCSGQDLPSRFPDVAAERAWVKEGKAIADGLATEWPGPLDVQISALDRLVRESRNGLSPWSPTSKESVAWIAERCGVAEIEAAIARLDELSRERDTLPVWDGDSQDDIAQAQELFRQILALVPARYVEDVAAALDSPEWGTRIYAASALAEHDRNVALSMLRGALSVEDEAVVRDVLERFVAQLEGGADIQPTARTKKA